MGILDELFMASREDCQRCTYRLKVKEGVSELDARLSGVYFVSAYMARSDMFEMRRLTIPNVIAAVIENTARECYWNFMRLCCGIGVLEPDPGRYVDWRKDWPWRFWRVRARRNKAREAGYLASVRNSWKG